MEAKEKEIVRTTIDLPTNLHEKLCTEADKQKRSRHSQMLIALEKFFETPNGNGNQSAGKPHLMMPKAEKVKITGKKEKAK